MAVKILSVDDENDLELLLTQYFRRKIRKGEYEFFFAHNGFEALKVLLEQPDISIILSDINMPEMDGLTLLTKINELRNPALKCIMVSAYGDMGNIRTAMNNGAFDFATKPIDLDDLSITIEKAIDQINYVKQSQIEHSQLVMIKGDLSVAAEIQQAILPKTMPHFDEGVGKFDLWQFMKPAKDIGGDFYDYFKIDDERIGLVMADVSGKGIPAAIFMAVSRTMVHICGFQQEYTAARCLDITNTMLCKESVDNMFVTVFYAIYNVKTGEINYCNAGHNPPYILRKNGRLERLPNSESTMLGVFEFMDYNDETTHLDEGDMLVMYTDGVDEACNV
ncbi:MAG: SpoIIE family protein phosphatase, partial [Prevotella sp.]|nr:SpoIIE family protein phosphatase [Prevotella sp.]